MFGYFIKYEFYIFLAVAASPFGAFRGKREDLLKYIGIKDNKKVCVSTLKIEEVKYFLHTF